MTTAEALRSGTFVLKADRIRGRGGLLVNVDPTINFVAVEGKDAYVQVSPTYGYGLNGLGGVTLKGKVTSLDISQRKKHGSYNIIMNTMGTTGNLTIKINVKKPVRWPRNGKHKLGKQDRNGRLPGALDRYRYQDF